MVSDGFPAAAANYRITSRGGGSFELKLLDAVTNLVPIHAQQRRRFRLVPAGALERLDDQRAFELLEIDAAGRQLDPIAEAQRRRTPTPGKSPRVSVSPSASSIARSMALRSSRMLPGHAIGFEVLHRLRRRRRARAS